MLWSAVKCFGGLRNFTWLPISTGVSRWWFNEIIFWVNWSFKVTDWSAEDDYAPQTLQQYLCKKAQNALLKDTDFHDGASKTSFGRRRCLLPTRLFLKIDIMYGGASSDSSQTSTCGRPGETWLCCSSRGATPSRRRQVATKQRRLSKLPRGTEW